MPNATNRSLCRTAHALAALTLVGSMLAGCNLVAGATMLVKGPPTVAAAYRLPEATTVVFVDDRTNVLPRRVLRETIGRAAEGELLRKTVVPDMVSSRSADLAVSQETLDEPLTIAQIGAAVGADQVIYVTIDAFTLSADGATLLPQAVLRVKVIDVATSERIWPDEHRGQEISPALEFRRGQSPESRTEMLRLQEELAASCGVAVAQLFFKHERTQSQL